MHGIFSIPLKLAVLAFCLLSGKSNAQYYSAGGEVSAKYLYSGGGENPLHFYELSVKLYKECTDESFLPPSINIKLFRANPTPLVPFFARVSAYPGILQSSFYITKQDANECAPAQPPVCYHVGVYTTELALSGMSGDYIIAVQDDQRKSANFKNVSTDGIGKLSGGIMGFTFTTRIPAGPALAGLAMPSTPQFKKEYPLILCTEQPFRYDFSATDPDGDSLTYAFVASTQGLIYVAPRTTNGTADMPPFLSLSYYAAFSGPSPLGSAVTIDSLNGMISGTGPVAPGRYLVNVEVSKHRNGKVIARHRKETTFMFSNCNWPRAQLDSVYRNCSGTSIKFLNYSTGQIKSYSWDFGDPTTNRDTSGLAEPTYTYPAPGVYTAKLYLNKGTTFCKDSATCKVIVDTGMNASFTLLRSLAVCNEALYDFTNTSTEGANPITSHIWDFGEPTTSGDVSTALHPSYSYPTEGFKTVRLIIGNDIGCSDTAFKTISAFKSLMQAPNDTIICYLDTIPLTPNTNGYPGIFSWSPDYRISSLTSSSPLVNPQRDTTYYVSFTDATGCVAYDSVFIKVRDSVKITIDNIDTTICRLDTIPLSVMHDGRNVTWQPSAYITPVNPDGSKADAFPFSSTMVIATSRFGSCFAEDTINIKVVPKPQVTISNDTTVCLGAPVHLHAGGGAFYLWSPAATLNNPVSPDPVAHPDRDIIYSVSVYDTLGCPKHTIATVKAGTFRALFAHAEKDTMVVEGEPVQLIGTGGQYYQWSPAQYLSSSSIPNPVARTYGDVTYIMKISDDDNCTDSAKVRIRAFKDPDIYVPTAFTPNNDGKNDLFKVFPVGFILQELKIYDRWGNVLFITNDHNKGWDGKYKGETMATGTFVWTASGINKKTGKPVYKKGNITLIR